MGLTTVAVSITACGGPGRSQTNTPATHKTPADETPAPTPNDGADSGGGESEVINLEALRVEVITDPDGTERVVAFDARDLFDRANEALVQGQPDEALQLYDELIADFSDSQLIGPALYNAGLALEAKGDYDGAVARYRKLGATRAKRRDAIDALVRASAVLAEIERWSDAQSVLDEVLARADLTESDKLEALARKGYVQLEAKDYSSAESTLKAAVDHYQKLVGNYHFESDYFIAMSYFYLGEIPRRQFVAIPIRLPESQMAVDLEAKASLVLLARERYDQAIDTGNLYWATASGYRLASMQKDFWTAIVLAPVPPSLSAKEAAIYREEVHKLALQHLEEALKVHTKTVELAVAYQSSTPWSDASKQEVTELTGLIAKEKAGDLQTPEPAGAVGTVSPGDVAPGGRDYVPGRVNL